MPLTYEDIEAISKKLREISIKPYRGHYGISRERGVFQIKDDAEYLEMLKNELELYTK